MEKILNNQLFNKNIQTLEQISLDKSNNAYLVHSQLKAIDFDNLKRDYCKQINAHENNTSSADALLEHRGKLLMIEFKNGYLSKMRRSDLEMMLKNKMLHSLIMFCDITNKTTSYTRKKMIFILVYNEEKNKVSRNYIKNHVVKKSKRKLVRFGLDKFPESFYNEVLTLTPKEFKRYLEKN